MGGLLSIVTLEPENPVDILANNPELDVGSSWTTYWKIDPLIDKNTIFQEQFGIIGYASSLDPYTKPYYIIRPIQGLSLPLLGILVPGYSALGNTKLSTLSVVENVNPGSEVIDLFFRSNYLDYEYEGSITPTGILTTSLQFKEANIAGVLQTPAYVTRELSLTNEVSGSNITLPYTTLRNVLVTRVPGGSSNDTLEAVSDIITHTDFSMSSESTNSTFRFYIKNTDAVGTITVLPGTGWSFGSYTIGPKKTGVFYASFQYNSVTADLVKVSEIDSVP